MALDTLAYTKHLESAGITRAQAEAHAEALRAHVVPDLATRDDIGRLELKLDASAARGDAKMDASDARGDAREARIVAEMHRLQASLQQFGLRLLSAGVAAMALLYALIKYT